MHVLTLHVWQEKIFKRPVATYGHLTSIQLETEFCGTKTETKFLMWKWKQKQNIIFRRNGCGNGIHVSD
jgi:hypothetical protein